YQKSSRTVSLHGEIENHKDSPSSVVADASSDSRHKRSSNKWKDDLSLASSTVTKSNQAGELISGSKLPTGEMTMSDEMDLLVEQVKMLAGDIAFSTSTLKHLLEQSLQRVSVNYHISAGGSYCCCRGYSDG
ncbi:hypothetical protein Ancab_004665, partial [Ancistrocladus abbreviatus]